MQSLLERRPCAPTGMIIRGTVLEVSVECTEPRGARDGAEVVNTRYTLQSACGVHYLQRFSAHGEAIFKKGAHTVCECLPGVPHDGGAESAGTESAAVSKSHRYSKDLSAFLGSPAVPGVCTQIRPCLDTPLERLTHSAYATVCAVVREVWPLGPTRGTDLIFSLLLDDGTATVKLLAFAPSAGFAERMVVHPPGASSAVVEGDGVSAGGPKSLLEQWLAPGEIVRITNVKQRYGSEDALIHKTGQIKRVGRILDLSDGTDRADSENCLIYKDVDEEMAILGMVNGLRREKRDLAKSQDLDVETPLIENNSDAQHFMNTNSCSIQQCNNEPAEKKPFYNTISLIPRNRINSQKAKECTPVNSLAISEDIQCLRSLIQQYVSALTDRRAYTTTDAIIPGNTFNFIGIFLKLENTVALFTDYISIAASYQETQLPKGPEQLYRIIRLQISEARAKQLAQTTRGGIWKLHYLVTDKITANEIFACLTDTHSNDENSVQEIVSAQEVQDELHARGVSLTSYGYLNNEILVCQQPDPLTLIRRLRCACGCPSRDGIAVPSLKRCSCDPSAPVRLRWRDIAGPGVYIIRGLLEAGEQREGWLFLSVFDGAETLRVPVAPYFTNYTEISYNEWKWIAVAVSNSAHFIIKILVSDTEAKILSERALPLGVYNRPLLEYE